MKQLNILQELHTNKNLASIKLAIQRGVPRLHLRKFIFKLYENLGNSLRGIMHGSQMTMIQQINTAQTTFTTKFPF